MINDNKNRGFIYILKDERFIEWKLSPTDETTEFWNKYLENNPHELENFRLAEQFFEKIDLSTYKISDDKKKRAINNLEAAVAKYRKRRILNTFSFVAAACVVAFAFILIFYQNNSVADQNEYIVGSELQSEDIQLIVDDNSKSFRNNIDIEITSSGEVQIKKSENNDEKISIENATMNKLIVPYGKRSTVTLADGSKVWLNSGSVLEFPTRFIGKTREVFLKSGEIYIEVAPDAQKSFFVNTTEMSVKVYGTKFNVSAYDRSPQSVVLVEGSVALKTAQTEEYFLQPNQLAKLKNDGGFATQNADVNEFISWKNGYLLFDETPMTEVLNQIERYYNLSFNYDKDVSLKSLTCSGRIVLSEDLDMVMTTIALITSTQFKKENNKIYLSNNPN